MPALSRLLRRRKTLPQTPERSVESETSTPTTQQAPIPEDTAEHDPPPYSASSNARGEQGAPSQDASQESVSISPTVELLDPNLNFTAALMDQQWREKDRLFARAVVQFIAERFDGNLKGWAGYKYTYICEVCLAGYLFKMPAPSR